MVVAVDVLGVGATEAGARGQGGDGDMDLIAVVSSWMKAFPVSISENNGEKRRRSVEAEGS
jgi:hypothetical protein